MNKTTKTIKCMNRNPLKSKWGDWAPDGGCKNEGVVGVNVTGWLCSSCTMRTTTDPGEIRRPSELG